MSTFGTRARQSVGQRLGDTSGDAEAGPDCLEMAAWETLGNDVGTKGSSGDDWAMVDFARSEK